MMKESFNNNSDVLSETSHRCNWSCLGPLTFHHQATGSKIRLSQGGHLAERKRDTFKNGLVFSSRPVRPNEKIRLRVEKELHNWHGGLRVGFTNVPPSSMSLPLPAMAIPDITNRPGHWATPVQESLCGVGSELEFWVSSGGSMYVTGCDKHKHKLKTGVDLSRPLWAMIDIYGNTYSIFLLGSKKVTWSSTKTSCPAPEHLTSSALNKHNRTIDILSLNGNSDGSISLHEDLTDEGCVVCMENSARVTLPCAHRCVCIDCYARISQEFGNCPLCRHPM
uniref:E3 ubiquitin-protein ligase NEURL3 n=1 Tax=Semicossyphus pulcher TaxID=241346 RepID=UPI0037E7C1C7